jgi:hypothetical protein
VRISRYVQVALHPIYEVVFYLAALFTAAWASGNAAEITNVVAGTTSFGAIADVLLLVTLTTVLHAINRWAVLIQREAAARSTGNVRSQLMSETDNLLEETAQVRRMVRTMPDEGFLDELGAKYMIASNAAGAILEADEEVESWEVVQAICIVLNALAEAAQHFDDRVDETYHVNIMTYHSIDDIREADAVERLQSDLTFERNEVSVDRFSGVLDLRANLSIQTTTEVGGTIRVDESIPNLVLAIREEVENENGQSFLLPGAPRAWNQRKADAYRDTDELVEWYTNNCVYDEDVERQIRAYFERADNGIGSLVSYALAYNEGEDDEIPANEHRHELLVSEDQLEKPIGVLNIHRASPGILRDNPEAGPYFHLVTRPLRLLCTRLLYKLAEVESEMYGTWENLTDHRSRE